MKSLQLICTSLADGIDGCLIVCKNEASCHIVGLFASAFIQEAFGNVDMQYLIHQSEDDLRVVLESAGKLSPESSKLSCGSSCDIFRIAYDAT